MEQFHIVDVKSVHNRNDNIDFYFAVLYSDLGYLVRAYMSEDDYKFLKSVDYYNYDLTDILHKRYNQGNVNKPFSYYIEIN